MSFPSTALAFPDTALAFPSTALTLPWWRRYDEALEDAATAAARRGLRFRINFAGAGPGTGTGATTVNLDLLAQRFPAMRQGDLLAIAGLHRTVGER
jgi:hypothetical protein